MQPAVHLRAAVALLGRFPALAGVDLDVSPGEIVLLRGPNGAGKTTLLRVCAGLAPVSSGEAVVLGVDLLRDRAAVRRRVGLLGHATFLYEDLTVSENVDFWARASGASLNDGRLALDRLEVAGRLHDLPVHALSSGQRRRVSFAAMVARRPELWLLDEPHAGLDPSGRDIVDGLVREAAAVGATVLFASHELDRADGVADRTVEVVGGTVVPVEVAAGAGSEPPRA
ncbi:MAG: heme ABC exporter ATP-binding protein CcmA [Actinobacteria bacterium]|nr:heme ABC exporter ATP-binding protein CcmA [Actinomycetota bacterium]